MEEELKEIIHKSHPDYTHDAAQCSYCQIVLLPDLLAFISAYGAAQVAAQRERDAGVAIETAREYSATQAVDETTRDYLTGAETCALRIAALIRA